MPTACCTTGVSLLVSALPLTDYIHLTCNTCPVDSLSPCQLTCITSIHPEVSQLPLCAARQHEKPHFRSGLTLLVLAVKQPTEINKLLVGNVLIVDANTLPLTTQEVSSIDSAGTAAIHCIKTLPVAPQLPSLSLFIHTPEHSDAVTLHTKHPCPTVHAGKWLHSGRGAAW